MLEQEPAAVKVMERLGQLMVQRLQQRDADLLRWLESQDATAAGSLEEYTALRKRLMSDWALQYHALGKPGKLAIMPSKPVGTAADFPFRLTVPGGELTAGGVTWVAVLPSHRR